MLDLFALRCTDPALLERDPDPVGADNDSHSGRGLARCRDSWPRGTGQHERVVCAWGTRGKLLDRDNSVIGRLVASGRVPVCFGKNADMSPKHPLYVPAASPVQIYMGRSRLVRMPADRP